MTRRKLTKKTSGGGSSDIPLRRSYERELKQELKYGDPREIRPRDRATEEEVRRMKLTRREQFLADCDTEIAVNALKNDPERLRLAQSLNEKAEELMKERGIPYPEAVRLAAQGSTEPTTQEVEAFAAENKMDFGTALRTLLRDHLHHDQAFGQPVESRVYGDGDMERVVNERMKADPKGYAND